jgi:hypothetical protein
MQNFGARGAESVQQKVASVVGASAAADVAHFDQPGLGCLGRKSSILSLGYSLGGDIGNHILKNLSYINKIQNSHLWNKKKNSKSAVFKPNMDMRSISSRPQPHSNHSIANLINVIVLFSRLRRQRSQIAQQIFHQFLRVILLDDQWTC